MHELTIAEIKKALPDNIRKNVNKDILVKINDTLSDPDMYETYRENLLSYASVMQDGKFKLVSYIDAVKYVSQKLMNKTNMAAFTAVFPEKIKRWNSQNVPGKDMASYVSAYNKSKLVTLITQQSLIPSWVLNQDLFQRALNTQAELMTTANSEKVRSDAANSILTHLKMPETQKVELELGVKKDSSIDALREATMQLVAQQKLSIQSGSLNAQEVAHSKVVIEGESEVVG